MGADAAPAKTRFGGDSGRSRGIRNDPGVYFKPKRSQHRQPDPQTDNAAGKPTRSYFTMLKANFGPKPRL